MPTNMPAFTAFALESCRSPGPARGDSQTLTMQLALAHPHAAEPMDGSASASTVAGHCAHSLRASVVPADGPVLTITF